VHGAILAYPPPLRITIASLKAVLMENAITRIKKFATHRLITRTCGKNFTYTAVLVAGLSIISYN
jgi:hypothetical protein